MPGDIFIDTNIIIYPLGQESDKIQRTAPLFVKKPFISTQVLSETINIAFKRLKLSDSEIRKLIKTVEIICRVEIITSVTIHHALEIRERYGFSWYDSLIVASAIGAGCSTLYSEDMQNGQEINGFLRVINPFL